MRRPRRKRSIDWDEEGQIPCRALGLYYRAGLSIAMVRPSIFPRSFYNETNARRITEGPSLDKEANEANA